ncbi:hypothetical protein EV359DRAFT_69283, partial [Lentinula novae-zelandiae]
MARQPGTGNRWTNSERDERPGSLFNELVVLPTLAPQLARPEYLDTNLPFVALPQLRSQQEQHGVLGFFPSSAAPGNFVPPTVDQADNDDDNDDDTVEQLPARLFSTSIQTEETKVELASGGRRSGTKTSTKIVRVTCPGPKVALLDLSRRNIVDDVIFGTINGQERYACSSLSGPPFQICSGGKSAAPVVRTDEEWIRVLGMFGPKLKDVIFIFDITESALAPYQRASAPLGHTNLMTVTAGTQ